LSEILSRHDHPGLLQRRHHTKRDDWISKICHNAHDPEQSTYGELTAGGWGNITEVLTRDLVFDGPSVVAVDLGSGSSRGLRRLVRNLVERGWNASVAYGVEESENCVRWANMLLDKPGALAETGLNRDKFRAIHGKIEDNVGVVQKGHFVVVFIKNKPLATFLEVALRESATLLRVAVAEPGYS
jgi:hypothetical protein